MTMQIDVTTQDEPIIVMKRTFDAPREKVWEVFTNPKHVSKWYGGHGFTNPVCEMDVRTGGIWRHVMRLPNGTEYPLEFVFLEVKKPEKIVWQNTDHGKRQGGPPTCVNTVTFEDAGTKTKWMLVARFATSADRDAAAKMGFTQMIVEGCEKFNDLVKAS